MRWFARVSSNANMCTPVIAEHVPAGFCQAEACKVSGRSLQREPPMWQAAAIGVDLVHAVLMVAWFAGLPLLFCRRWPRAARAYAIYAIAFVGSSWLSQRLWGECFVTAIALYCWEHVPSSAPVSNEWFTVRIARTVFHLAPSHRSIVLVSEAMIVATAVGVLLRVRQPRARGARASPSNRSDEARWGPLSPGERGDLR
jgi:hypothetical protein